MPTIKEIAPHIGFGTSGVRALVSDLSDQAVYAFVAAFLAHVRASGQLGRSASVILGHDLRPSSPDIAAACAAAIASAGLATEYVGALPTPALALRCLARAAPGIMVTGSHIPFDRNGIKFYTPKGEILKADESGIRDAAFVLPDDTAATPSWRVQLPGVRAEAMEAYLARYLDFFGDGWLSGMRVGVFQHSSVARDSLSDLLQRMEATVVALGRSDSFVPIDTEAVSQDDLNLARAWCRAERLDALVSTDGDADRPLMFDENGEFLRGDVIGILTAAYLGAAAVVTPVSSNTALEKSGLFACTRRTRIGSPYVIEAMQGVSGDLGTVVGFEANGGFLVATPLCRAGKQLAPLPTRDAFLPMLAMLAMARQEGCPLSRLPLRLPARYTASDRLRDIPSAASVALIEALASDRNRCRAFCQDIGAVVDVDTTDGLRLTLDHGDILHYRPSGNAPELRCYAESNDFSRAQQLMAWGLGRIARQLAAAR